MADKAADWQVTLPIKDLVSLLNFSEDLQRMKTKISSSAVKWRVCKICSPKCASSSEMSRGNSRGDEPSSPLDTGGATTT